MDRYGIDDVYHTNYTFNPSTMGTKQYLDNDFKRMFMRYLEQTEKKKGSERERKQALAKRFEDLSDAELRFLISYKKLTAEYEKRRADVRKYEDSGQPDMATGAQREASVRQGKYVAIYETARLFIGDRANDLVSVAGEFSHKDIEAVLAARSEEGGPSV